MSFFFLWQVYAFFIFGYWQFYIFLFSCLGFLNLWFDAVYQFCTVLSHYFLKDSLLQFFFSSLCGTPTSYVRSCCASYVLISLLYYHCSVTVLFRILSSNLCLCTHSLSCACSIVKSIHQDSNSSHSNFQF